MQVMPMKNADDFMAVVARASDVLRAGGVVLYPTDTLYGLGADALSDEAVGRIYTVKGRPEGKPVHALVSDMAIAEKYADVGDAARKLARELPRGKVSFVVPKKQGFDSGICRGIPTFGFRIPDNDFCQALLKSFGNPITATSANPSGEGTKRSAREIVGQLGAAARYIDLIIDAGELPERKPSTVVDFTSAEPAILREGAVSAEEVRRALRASS